jgi:hypothetical protein
MPSNGRPERSERCERGAKEPLDEAKEMFRNLWMQRTELEQQLDLERDLRAILSTESFSCQARDFQAIIENQLNQLTKNHREPLLEQIESLARTVRELEQSSLSAGKEPFKTPESTRLEIGHLRAEIADLGMEIEELLSQISGFDDEEIHLLRAERQHIELTRRKFASAHHK